MGGLPAGLSVRIQSPEYRETIYPAEGGELLAFQGTETIPGSDDDLVYIVLTNTGTSDRTIGVSVDEAHTTMTPPVPLIMEGDWGKTPVHFAVENIPLGIDTVKFWPYPHMATETGQWFPNVTVNGGRAEITYYMNAEGGKKPGDYEGWVDVACYMATSPASSFGFQLDEHRFTHTIVPRGT